MKTRRKVVIILLLLLLVLTMTAGSCNKSRDCLSDDPRDCNEVVVNKIRSAPTQCPRDAKGNCK